MLKFKTNRNMFSILR